MDNDINEVKILAPEASSEPRQHVKQEDPLMAVIMICVFLIIAIGTGGLLKNAMGQSSESPDGKTGTSTSTTSDTGDSLLLTQ